jgi:hypothetical protein
MFSLARLRKSSLSKVGVRGLSPETEEAELGRNFCGGVVFCAAGILLFPLLGVNDLPTKPPIALNPEFGV